jgi:glutathione S-transferase
MWNIDEPVLVSDDSPYALDSIGTCPMIQIYFDPGCPYCVRVLDHLERTEIPYEKKQISLRADSEIRRELVVLGGRSQVPFLHDPERDVRMFESEDIVEYIDRHYAHSDDASRDAGS